MKYLITLFETDNEIKYECQIELEYVPECFIFEGEVYTVTHEGHKYIKAILSTPCAIELKRDPDEL